MKLAVDMASILKTCLAAGKDPEGKEVEFEGSTSFINSAMYAYENSVNSLKAALEEFKLTPISLIMVTEGMHSKSRRKAIYPQYKESRSTRPPEYYEEYQKLQELVRSQFCALGAIEVTQPYVEGDDILGFLAEHSEEDLIVMSNDGDLTVLNKVNKHGKSIQVRINGETGRNKYGGFPCHLVTAYKALVGDSSDSIKGCPGFGPAKFLEFISKYGEDGFQELHDLMEQGSLMPLEQLAEDNNCKIIRKIFEERESVLKSFAVAKLYPNWCDTLDNPLEWNAGMVVKLPMPDERLAQWQGQKRLVGAANYVAAMNFLKSKLLESPFVAFDIETSTPDESSDWLERTGKPDGVDVIGSYLCGFSITFGANNQYTYYVSVKHASSDNITMKQAREMIETLFGKEIVIQNTNFELVVLAGAEDEDGSKWIDLWQEHGQQGYLPGVLDTKLEASYVNENVKLGLKERSKLHLGYEQETYEQVTTIEGVQHKMHELTAQHAFNYGCDDTICTAALHNFYRLHMQLEHCYETYKEVEIAAAYANAAAMVSGIPFSMERMSEIEQEDKESSAKVWPVLRNFLIASGWEGTVPPSYTKDITPAKIKEAYQIALDKPLNTAIRTMSKIVTLIREVEGEEIFAGLLEKLLTGDVEPFNKYILSKFLGEPVFNLDSPVQMKKLMYEVLNLPVRLTNKVTDVQRANGVSIGTAKTDDLAIQSAIHYDSAVADLEVLKAIQILKQCGTRSKLFYEPYRGLCHWKTGKLHPSTNQSATVTRRNTSSGPNYAQWPAKGDGIRFRECVVARGKGRVVISADCSGQELRLAADFSRDPAMMSCYIGDNKKDIHSMVASTATRFFWDREWSYEEFYSALKGGDDELANKVDALRTKSKAVVFGEIYGSQAKSLSSRLMISEEEAQIFLDAKKAQFPGVDIWKDSVTNFAREHGYSLSKLGARRHLRPVLATGDKWEIARAERQLSNFCIQASGAEAVKIALGNCFKSEVFKRCDVHLLVSVYDEIVLDCPAEHAYEVATELVKFMEAPFADMEVPFVSEATIGVDFGKQFRLPLKFSKEDVQKRLDELFN
jgi:DNA polymerase I-like protein with 3'-5' exonuclease and polymerase domains/5'-3' exonuclease